MNIRLATPADLDTIMRIYDEARLFMREQGNLKQWSNGYPQRELLQKDILNQNCYVCVLDDQIVCVFCYFTEPDPTYNIIVDGAWPNNEPYGTIHRIATICHRKGVANACYDFALEKCQNLRIDTHRDNIPMQRSLAKYGFLYCGTIFLADGSPRIAFQITRSA